MKKNEIELRDLLSPSLKFESDCLFEENFNKMVCDDQKGRVSEASNKYNFNFA